MFEINGGKLIALVTSDIGKFKVTRGQQCCSRVCLLFLGYQSDSFV